MGTQEKGHTTGEMSDIRKSLPSWCLVSLLASSSACWTGHCSVPRTAGRIVLNTFPKVPSLDLSLPLWSAHPLPSLFSEPRLLPRLPSSPSRGWSQLKMDCAFCHMLGDAPVQISQATQLDLEWLCQRYLPKLRSWVVARLRAGKRRVSLDEDEAEEIQGGTLVNCVSNAPTMTQHHRVLICSICNFRGVNAPSAAPWPVSCYQRFSAGSQNSRLLSNWPS